MLLWDPGGPGLSTVSGRLPSVAARGREFVGPARGVHHLLYSSTVLNASSLNSSWVNTMA